MRIVDVCGFYSPFGGGVKTYIERKLVAGPAMGHDITIIAPSDHDGIEERSKQARVVHIKARKFQLDPKYFYFDNEMKLHEAITASKPDILAASSPWRSASQTARWSGAHIPRALIMHADPLSAYAYRWFGRILARDTIDRRFEWFWRHLRRLDAAYDAVICANEDLGQRLHDGGLAKVVVNPMGVEDGIFSPVFRDEHLRARLLARCGLSPHATLLLGAGRLSAEKRWPFVADAVVAAGHKAPIGLIIAGDGRNKRSIARYVRDLPHVQLIAPTKTRAQFARLLASADALIHGCEAETFGMVGAEARASGLPVVAPDQGGIADQARGPGSRLYTANDVGSAAAAISDFVAEGAAQARALATAQAGSVRTMDQHFADLFALYAQMRANA
ncbi:MAG: glycosyltransferase [Alphaproteobacteria bacterium]|nr:glycosyltransferase [Alphaproteobacteria bacterium]MDE2041478.1 glycosyltransferase [Alphaproteobacteria bacterium]MDE2341145.1 glycosyltransferase [Alphaproteobacteria bacterium]